MNTQEISKYYDDFVPKQATSSLNERIFSLFKRIRKAGLKTHSNVLELGCGIGAFSFLLSKVVKKGTIEAVDISAESIAFAKSKIKKRNIVFKTSDILHYKPEQSTYDFITLFDVIEHIPLNDHDILFKNVSNHMNEHSKLLINIPNPRYTEYDRMHQPELLQIVDETVYLNELCAVLYKNNLYIHLFETYSIWAKADYQFLIVYKNHPFEEVKLSRIRTLPQKIKDRLKREFRKRFYRF